MRGHQRAAVAQTREMMTMYYKISNEHKHMINVLLEPWAEEFELPPSSELSLEIHAEGTGVISTETNASFFVIWLWRTCTAKVSINGVEQLRSFLLTPCPI